MRRSIGDLACSATGMRVLEGPIPQTWSLDSPYAVRHAARFGQWSARSRTIPRQFDRTEERVNRLLEDRGMVAGTSCGHSVTSAILGQIPILVQRAGDPGGATCSLLPFKVIREGAAC